LNRAIASSLKEKREAKSFSSPSFRAQKRKGVSFISQLPGKKRGHEEKGEGVRVACTEKKEGNVQFNFGEKKREGEGGSVEKWEN